jgi:hypothetical protein
MAGGRPTLEPKGTLVAVRLADRQRLVLEQRARREGVALSEALRRCVDEWAAWSRSTSHPQPRPPTAAEQRTFDAAFAALGLIPRRSTRRRRRR